MSLQHYATRTYPLTHYPHLLISNLKKWSFQLCWLALKERNCEDLKLCFFIGVVHKLMSLNHFLTTMKRYFWKNYTQKVQVGKVKKTTLQSSWPALGITTNQIWAQFEKSYPNNVFLGRINSVMKIFGCHKLSIRRCWIRAKKEKMVEKYGLSHLRHLVRLVGEDCIAAWWAI